MRQPLAVAAAVGGILGSGVAADLIQESVRGAVFRPAKVAATPERLKTLEIPQGFSIEKIADGLEAPRMMALSEQGDLYVTRRAPHNDVLLLRRGDGRNLEAPRTVAGIPDVHGIAIRDGKVYLAAVRKLYVAELLEDGTFSEPRAIYDDLPDAGQHPNRTLAFSPDGELFLSVGSTCNAAPEPNRENATMLRVKTDGSGREIFASGLRNTIGFDWHPDTKELWGMDHGIDWLGDEVHEEELNRIRKGKQYGWPFVFEDGQRNPADDPKESTGMTWEEYAAASENMVLGYDAHAAPMALVFYTGEQFPDEYRGDAFVTLHGSWNRGDPSGYEVARVRFDNDGRPVAFEPFLTGFFVGEEKAQFGRPCGLIQDRDGSLLMSDDSAGAIYRISFSGGKNRETAKR